MVLSSDNSSRQSCYRTRHRSYEEFDPKWERECYKSEYRTSVAIPYIDGLVSDIEGHFAEGAVKLLVSSSIFNPASFPAEEFALPEYGNKEIQVSVDFHGKEATIEFEGEVYSSPPLVDSDEILAEWRVFESHGKRRQS